MDDPSLEERVLYEAGGVARVRFATWFLFALMLLALRAGWWVHNNLLDNALQPASPGLRLGMGAAIAGIGVLFFLGIVFYLRFYTVRLHLLPRGTALRVTTLRLFGTGSREVDRDALSSATFHTGQSSRAMQVALPRMRRVNAPFYRVRVQGGRSFLLDMNGDFRDPEALQELVGLDPAIIAERG